MSETITMNPDMDICECGHERHRHSFSGNCECLFYNDVESWCQCNSFKKKRKEPKDHNGLRTKKILVRNKCGQPKINKCDHLGICTYANGYVVCDFCGKVLNRPKEKQMDKKATVGEYLDILGYRVRDKITGMTGVVQSVSFDLFGCVQVVVGQGVDKDGKLKDMHWLDFHRMEIVSKKRVMEPPSFMSQATILSDARAKAPEITGPSSKPAPKM